MKRILTNLLLISGGLIALVAHSAQAQQTAPVESVRVHGQATLAVEPDQAVLSFQIVKRGRGVAKLKQFVDMQSQQVVGQLKKFNIADKDIQSSQIIITPIFKEQPELLGAEVRDRRVGSQVSAYVALDEQDIDDQIEGFKIERTISVVVRDLTNYDRVIDGALKLGINQLNRTSYRVSSSDEKYQQALALAVENAKLKAEKLAQVAGRKLGKIISVEERSSAPMMAMEAVQSYRANYQSNHGQQNINARVEVQFIFN